MIPQIYFSVREKKAGEPMMISSRMVFGSLFGISIALLIFIVNRMYGSWDPVNDQFKMLTNTPGFKLYEYISALFLLLYGIPTFVTGMTMKFKPMFWGGILCWISCIASLFLPVKTDMLLIALSAAGAWLIPGIIMERDYQRAKKHLANTDV
ncbi:MAG: hypothetical protein IPP99_15885 [Chitinophagaceae bacterium]|nr:hypothetical protein [Chitinophagaceae bacterium]